MFLEILKKNFNENEAILSSEILSLFKFFSHSYVYRHINEALKAHQLIKFSNGVYYLPGNNMGELSPLEVIKKRFISNNNEIYGIFSGNFLINKFTKNKQINNNVEIISNKEKSRARVIKIKSVSVVIKKSRLKITKENYKVYTLLEFFSIFEALSEQELDLISINNYIKENNITKKDLCELLYKFPSKVGKKIMILEIMK